MARLHAFGSVLRPDYRPGESDIDLLVEFQPLEPAELAQIVGPELDLVMATALRNPIVKADIEASRQVIYAA